MILNCSYSSLYLLLLNIKYNAHIWKDYQEVNCIFSTHTGTNESSYVTKNSNLSFCLCFRLKQERLVSWWYLLKIFITCIYTWKLSLTNWSLFLNNKYIEFLCHSEEIDMSWILQNKLSSQALKSTFPYSLIHVRTLIVVWQWWRHLYFVGFRTYAHCW